MSKTFSFVKKHESVKLLILAVLLVSASFITWNGLKIALNTENPVLVVVSGSMIPTLNVGDLIIIRGESPEQISVGTIIVFHSPINYNTLIVHRIVEKIDHGNDFGFKTKGDYNLHADNWIVNSENIIGSYIGKIPYIGIIIIKLKEPAGMSLLIFLIVVMIIFEFLGDKKKERSIFH